MVRAIKKIFPDQVNEKYTEYNYIHYTLPPNIIDLWSIQKYFTALVDDVERYAGNNTYLHRFLPTNSSSIIDTLEIYRDGELIQVIPEYNTLHQIYQDTKDEYVNNSDSKKPDTIYDHDFDPATNFVGRTREFFNTVNPAKKYDYCISNWLGFLNPKNRYLDCREKQVRISIKLAPKFIAYRGLRIEYLTSAVAQTFDNWSYYISNCFINLMVVYNEDVDLTNEIFFNDFSHFKNNINTHDKNFKVKGKTNKNIKYLIATCTDSDRLSDTGLQLQHLNENHQKFGDKIKYNVPTSVNSFILLREQILNKSYPVNMTLYNYETARQLQKANLLNNSIYFKRNGIDIRTNQFRVNSVDITPPMQPLETFNNIKRVFNTDFKIAPNVTSFVNDFYINAFEYNSEDNEVSNVEWEIVADGKNYGGQAHLFLVHNNSIKI